MEFGIHILTLTSQLILWLQASHICGTPLPINILSLLGYPYGRDNLMEIEKQRSLGKISEPNDTYSINYPLMEAQSIPPEEAEISEFKPGNEPPNTRILLSSEKSEDNKEYFNPQQHDGYPVASVTDSIWPLGTVSQISEESYENAETTEEYSEEYIDRDLDDSDVCKSEGSCYLEPTEEDRIPVTQAIVKKLHLPQGRNKNPYSYHFVSRKLWYIPLFFSVWFMIYVFAIVVKSIARHKIEFPISEWKSPEKEKEEHVEHVMHDVHEALHHTKDGYIYH